jgi:hypothetical protein
MSFKPRRALILAAAFVFATSGARPETPNIPTSTGLTSAQIVEQMQHTNQVRTDGLKHYKALRHYQVEYKGFGADIAAKMEVEVDYDAPAAKSFRIVTQSGSKLLLEKVLKRLLQTEKDAAQDQSATALSQANYRFTTAGIETVGGRPSYILSVEPLKDNKLLYRGKIWVDATDFAVVKIDAAPAKNPSFWIASTQINHTYAKTGNFWLPQQNRSESKVRVGGTAVLTIDYGTYQIDSATPRPAMGN